MAELARTPTSRSPADRRDRLLALFACDDPVAHPWRSVWSALAPVALWPLLLVALAIDRLRHHPEPIPRAEVARRPRHLDPFC